MSGYYDHTGNFVINTTEPKNGIMTQPTASPIDELRQKNEILKAIEIEAQKCAIATEYYDELITGGWTKLPLQTKSAINDIGNKILDIIHNG